MRQTAAVSAVGLVFAGSLAFGDALVLRSGRRIEGELIGVRGDTIEFQEDGSSRTYRYDRGEVRRIELDETGTSRSGRTSRDEDSSSRSGGMRERSVTVDSRSAWTDAGVEVRAGQRIRFEATGEIRWGPGRKDGPEGEGGSHSNSNRPMPNRPGAALIGRVGSGSDLFFIGNDQGEIRVRNSGRLYLGVNDDYLQDNSGSFRVIVYY
jgi:hypothetical protein